MFDKLFELASKSARFGFALAFAGTVFVFGNINEWWPIKLSPENVSYIIYATLLGYGILLAVFLANAFKVSFGLFELFFAWIAKVRRERNIMDKLNELTPRQTAALWWISQNPNAPVHGSLYQDPFRSLCAKGFLYASSQKAESQGFRVNRRVFKQSSKIAEKLPKGVVDQLPKQAAPWN